MIQMKLSDGTAFTVEGAEILIRVGKGEDRKVYGWSDVAEVMLIDGEYAVADGKFGGPNGMPIRAFTWTDTSDLRVSVPMPLEAARDMGRVLANASKIEVVKALPGKELIVAQQKPPWTPPTE